MSQITACSRALRNSDYVEPDIKRQLLREIVRSWEQVSKALVALSPMLVNDGYASFEGAAFLVVGALEGTFEQKMYQVLQVNPRNVIGMFKDDLYSNKLGPLLYDQLSNEKNDFILHQLILFIAYERPNGWRAKVEEYIVSISKDSFYLFDILDVLRAEYRYAFVDKQSVLTEIAQLIKLGYAKNIYGDKKPNPGRIRQMLKEKIFIKPLVPKREFEDEDEIEQE